MKKLLILGGTNASLEVLNVAKSMGIYTVVTDEAAISERPAKQLADEAAMVDTTDIEGLKALINEKKIDGVFCGPSEFNILNALNICKAAGLPFYCTYEQWKTCSNKALFKQMCRENNVPVIPEYNISDDKCVLEFPVIVKPVDGCSSSGISVCRKKDEFDDAYSFALEHSDTHTAVVEKYIQNNGVGVSVRYIINDGKFYLSLMGDRYVTDPYENTSLTTQLVIYPSKYTDRYKRELDGKVQNMFKSIGINNGVLFMQALPEGDNIYFHEMGLRLSGGLPYVITEAANGINDVKMMIRYAVGGKMCEEDEIERIDPFLNGKHAVIFSVPLKSGRIAVFNGAYSIEKSIKLISYTQYYHEGDEVSDSSLGTTMQFGCRFKFFAENATDAAEKINLIQDNLCIKDDFGNDMIYKYFDTGRITE